MSSRDRKLTTVGHHDSPSLDNEIGMPANLNFNSLLEDAAEASSTTNPESRRLSTEDLELRSILLFGSFPASPDSESFETTFRKIGAGACGAVFARNGKSKAIKLSKTTDEMALYNDYSMHVTIFEQFGKWHFEEARVPKCHYFVEKDEPDYFNKRPGFVAAAEEDIHLPTSALVSRRIPPLPKRARTLLIDKYCAPPMKEAAHGDVANRDCLVRVYLGSLQGPNGGRFFSLRNFKMYLGQMVDLQLDVEAIASRMGVAMAITHWAAKTDARDVEFVLGSSYSRGTELWVLDFNQVQVITMDEDGVKTAIEAAWINDPYFPRPLGASRTEKLAWNAFVRNYIVNADRILGQDNGQNLFMLPRMFIRGLIEAQKKRRQAASNRG
ncbi:zinc finger domain-containing protein [Trichoderma barbatum]